MSISPVIACRWVLSLAAVSLLAGCQTSKVMVEKTELAALSQCHTTLQTQQVQYNEVKTRLDEQLALAQASLEIQRRLADAPPPAPVVIESRMADCPKPAKQAAPAPSALENALQEKQLIGERENVLINALGIELRARINTGITLSMLDARNVQLFERNGEEWVRFTLFDPKTKTDHELERKRIRFVTGTKADDQNRRPVVDLRVTLGKLTQSVEFALVDRADQSYPIVIGRNVLRDVMVVDVSKSDLAKPVAPKENNEEKAKP